MTIRFLQSWNGYDDQDIATLSSEEETRLVGLGLATYTIRAARSAPATDSMVFESAADIPAGVVGPVWLADGTYYYFNQSGAVNGGIAITSAELTQFRQQILINPLIAPPVGTGYLVTDGLLANTVVYFTGDSFQPGGIVSASYPATFIAEKLSNGTTDTTAENIHQLNIPGFLMGARSVLNIIPYWQTTNVNSNTRNTATRIFQTGTVSSSSILAASLTSTNLCSENIIMLRNCNTYNLQKVHNANLYGSSGANPPEHSLNTLEEWSIQFFASWTANQTPTQASIRLTGYRLFL
jgi:hypothetical protein